MTTLNNLHWLRVPQRIQYKLTVLAYKVLHGGAPSYLGPFFRVADLPGRRALRSAGFNRLVVPPVKLSNIVLADSLSTIRRQLNHYIICSSSLTQMSYCNCCPTLLL